MSARRVRIGGALVRGQPRRDALAAQAGSQDTLAARHHLTADLAASLAGINALTDALVAS